MIRIEVFSPPKNAAKNYIGLTSNKAALSPGCKPRNTTFSDLLRKCSDIFSSNQELTQNLPRTWIAEEL